MLLYTLPATIVFFIISNALLKDSTTPNSDMTIWMFILLASLIWPLTLPSIIRKKVMDWHKDSKTHARLA